MAVEPDTCFTNIVSNQQKGIYLQLQLWGNNPAVTLVYILHICPSLVIIENVLLHHHQNIEKELIKGALALPSSMSVVYGAAFSCSSEACHPYSCDIFWEALLCLLKIADRKKESNKARYCIKKSAAWRSDGKQMPCYLFVFLTWLMKKHCLSFFCFSVETCHGLF